MDELQPERFVEVKLPFEHTRLEAVQAVANELAADILAGGDGWHGTSPKDRLSEFAWDELERIMTATVCIQVLVPTITFQMALKVAIVWERG